jgi:hypothetical protein
MHQVILTRGPIQWVNKFIRELRSQYTDFPMYNPESKTLEPRLLPIRVSPVQLWDISFNKSARDGVLNTILPQGEGTMGAKSVQKCLFPLRWALGLKKTAPFKKDKLLRMSLPQHMDVISIGEKEDLWIEPDGRNVEEKDKSDLAYEGI